MQRGRFRFASILYIIAGYLISTIVLSPPAIASGKGIRQWRRILVFDVLDTARIHKADLGNHRVIIATYMDPAEWDIGVYQYPYSLESLNLLYNGHNWHGIQAWFVSAWTKHKQIYPDVRLIKYGSPKRMLKIVLKDCETRQEGETIIFKKGKIEIYHNP